MRIAIIHFAPIELYPPAQNLLRFIEKNKDWSVKVFSTGNVVRELETFLMTSQQIKIVRIGSSTYGKGIVRRLTHYFQFYFVSIIRLISQRPDRILYFETLSSFPAYIYKRFINSKAKLFIHYHEYTTTMEYENGMLLSKWFHLMERKLYQESDWISHTNNDRIELFLKDIEPIQPTCMHVLPNYPPRKWALEPKSEITSPVRIIYVGALSMTTQYTIEFAEWVKHQGGKVIWDVYSYNHSTDVVSYLNNVGNPWIRFCGGINYNQLPSILKNYHIGVILYKGHIPNYVYNAPNKLFEYLACGLDVWIPDVMKGARQLITNGNYPRVISVDFTKMQTMNLKDMVNRVGLRKNVPSYFCESVLTELEDKLNQSV